MNEETILVANGEDRAITVSELNTYIKNLIDGDVFLNRVVRFCFQFF